MPPKKRSRISTTTSPAPPVSVPEKPASADSDAEAGAEAEAEAEADAEAERDDAIVNDPWTNDEEIGLFKGLIKYKPTGMHKHFHMLSLHQHLRANGYIHPAAPHTSIAGVWAKLHALYDLEALDEREDAESALLRPPTPRSGDGDDGGEHDGQGDTGDAGGLKGEGPDDADTDAGSEVRETSEFRLPDDDEDEALVGGEDGSALRFRDLVWRARFVDDGPGAQAQTQGRGMRSSRKRGDEGEGEGEVAADIKRSESPVLMPGLMPGRESPPVRFVASFIVPQSEEPVAAAAGTGRIKGQGRGGAAAAAAASRGRGRGVASAATRRSGRVAESVAPEEDEEKEEEEEEEEEEDDIEEEEDEEEEEEANDEKEEAAGEEKESEEGKEEKSEEENGTPAPRGARSRTAARARSRPKGKRRR